MAAVGLLYVGAVLFLNGAMLLGWVEARSAAPLNLFVGLLQVLTPTYLIFTAGGDANAVLNASGLYLFGFTYLYVACNLFAGLDSTGVGYYSLFVAVAALVYSYLNFTRLGDPAFGVLWLHWGFLWLLFFLLMGRKIEALARYTGAVTLVQAWVSAAIPACLLLTGVWTSDNTLVAQVLGVVGVVVFGALFVALRPGRTRTSTVTAGASADAPAV